jgi:predicted phosphoribosyltransferase
MGAVGEGGELVVDDQTVQACRVQPDQLRAVVASERNEVDARVADYRAGRPPLPVSGCTAILIDDGVATGATLRAACHVVQTRAPQRVVVGVPVGPAETLDQLRAVCDEVVCVTTPRQFFAVGQWYRDFAPFPDADVRRILEEHLRIEAPD